MLKDPLCYDWLVIGGGPQGLALAGALVQAGYSRLADLAIVDSGPAPLWAWRARVARCGMIRLRSDVRYHLDCWPVAVPYTLDEWATDYFRPTATTPATYLLDETANHVVASTALFDAHCDWFVAQYGLGRAWQQGNVSDLVRLPGEQGWQVSLADGRRLQARRVVLATGACQLNYPAWAANLRPVYHLLDLSQPEPDWAEFEHLTVVGGGLSSANFVLDLCRQGFAPAKLTLLLRHPIKLSLLEADLSTLEAPFQASFRQGDYAERRRLISGARQGGTLPPQVYRELLQTGVEIVQGEVCQAQEQDGQIRLELSTGQVLTTSALVLGTGHCKGLASPLVERLSRRYAQPLSACGFAMPAPSLEWLPGLYLLGGPAELELGPVCRNLAGAGQGVARIMDSFAATPVALPQFSLDVNQYAE